MLFIHKTLQIDIEAIVLIYDRIVRLYVNVASQIELFKKIRLMKTLILNILILMSFFNLCYSQYFHDYVTIFESIPENDEEHVNIFDDEPKFEDKKIFEKGYLEYISGESMKGKGFDDFLKIIVKHKTKSCSISCFIIIGHNDNGFLKFANGESVAITELEKLLEGIRTIFLPYNSNEFLLNYKNIGVNHPIQLSDAITVSNKINKYFYSYCDINHLSNTEIDKDIIEILKMHRFNKNTTEINSCVISTGGIIYFYKRYEK